MPEPCKMSPLLSRFSGSVSRGSAKRSTGKSEDLDIHKFGVVISRSCLVFVHVPTRCFLEVSSFQPDVVRDMFSRLLVKELGADHDLCLYPNP